MDLSMLHIADDIVGFVHIAHISYCIREAICRETLQPLVELSHFCISFSNFGFEYKLGISFSSGICCMCGPG